MPGVDRGSVSESGQGAVPGSAPPADKGRVAPPTELVAAIEDRLGFSPALSEDVAGVASRWFADNNGIMLVHVEGVGLRLSPEDCLRFGGHAFERTGYSTSGVPTRFEEVCRFCSSWRQATPREPFEYTEPLPPGAR